MDSLDDAVAQDQAEMEVIVLPAELIEGLRKLDLGADDSATMYACLKILGPTVPRTPMVLQTTSTIQTL
jgi:hypothetical protein